MPERMVTFKTTLHKFDKQGEKTGWTFIDVDVSIAQQLKPGNKKSFRVKGKIDQCVYKGVGLLPMGEGDFIMAINAQMRKKIGKKEGDAVTVEMTEDKVPVILSSDLMACLADDPGASAFFDQLPSSHKLYFSKWIESAKTPETKAKRIARSIHAFQNKMGYAEMIRASRENKM